MNFNDRPGRPKRERERRRAALLAANPDYKFRETVRPSIWDETVLTERWEDRKARLARERAA